MFNRYWNFGWVNPKPFDKLGWMFHFYYYKNCVWQLMILGFYITSTNKSSVLIKKEI